MKKMRAFESRDLFAMPAAAAVYSKKTFTAGMSGKWLPAGLAAFFIDLQTVFGELFWVIVGLWICDFMIGFLRAWHDPEDEVDWTKAFRSVLKLLVIGFAAVAVHFMEVLISHGGIDTQQKLVGAVLIVIGITEATSILDNLTYFWPGLGDLVKRAKDLMGRAKNGHRPRDRMRP